ncbi:MAG: type II toxin-antitoxin system VapC family toxin [Akkermansiaceae bacterium]|nr:type II toxin-antitoxin system VapC family toxin [Akkermansiaceae bacterium]
MSWLLDTVVVSEFRKDSRADSSVLGWQDSVLGEQLWLSVISLNELRFGFKRVETKDPEFAARLRDWYDNQVTSSEEIGFLPVDRSIAEISGEYRAEFGMNYNDALIAATAKVHDLRLVTRNVKDFASTGIRIVNPWDYRK